MHSFIIQVSRKPIETKDFSEDFISEIDYGFFGIDYAGSTSEDAVDVLLRYNLPEGLSINKEERSIVWDGSRKFIGEYKRRVSDAHEKFQKRDDFSMFAFQLKEVLDRCFFGNLVFCQTDGGYGCNYPMDFINHLMCEKKMYIGGCLDYHF